MAHPDGTKTELDHAETDERVLQEQVTEGARPQVSAATLDWFKQVRRPGHWFSIPEGEELPIDLPPGDRNILHAFQIWFGPEIERRLADGRLDNTFVLEAAQFIQPLSGEQFVRLNSEIRGVMLLDMDPPFEKGDVVYFSDIKNLKGFDLPDDELDCGHFTIIWNGTRWSVAFDFRGGRAKSIQMIESARQFLHASRYCAEQGFAGPSIDNLFSACELLSKAHLILQHSPAAQAKSHGPIGSALNFEGRLGNINADFVRLYNTMARSRSPARYDPGAMLALPTPEEFQIITSELDLLARAIAPFRPVSHESDSPVNGEGVATR